jgi:uncharacterized repeat protein (TIGR01451 family)
VRPQSKSALHRRPPRLEQLEDRVTPSILGTFELDGNATTGVLGSSGSTTTSHDWDQVFADAGSPAGSGNFSHGSASGALAGGFFTDAVNTNTDDIFQGGGSKDTQGIQEGQWLFTGGKPQGKNDITHAYAAAYTDASNGHLILFAGLDRFDNSGDATAGFWFFRNNIGQNPKVTTNGGHPFTGVHADGDILLISNFTQGGSVSTIAVYKWVGDDSTGSLQFVGGSASNTFAIVNGSPVSVPWSYTNKSGRGQPAAGEFLEEGVDLTALNLQGCFSSFLAETRSSQSPTATLSDFVLGSFPVCSLAAPEFTGLSKVGDPVTYPLTVQNTGAMPLFIQSVSDTVLGNIVVNHTLQQPGAAGVDPAVTSISTSFDFSQPLQPGASLTVFVTRTVQSGDPDPTTSTVSYVGTDDLAGLEDQITASAVNSVNLFQPSASMTVTADPTTATTLGQPITYTYTVTNTSSSDSPNLVLDLSNPNDSFTDTLLGNLEADAIHAAAGNNTATAASIAPGASFTFTETRAIQAGDPTPLTNTATVHFTLAQNFGNFSNIIHASSSASVTLLPHLEITKAVTSGFPSVIHPGDTASFTITVANDGAGPATNVLVTDQLPAADQLTWVVFSSSFDTTSMSPGDLLTASSASLAAGATESVTVQAVIPLDIFGSTGGGGTGSGNVLAAGVFELDGNATTGVLGASGSTTTSHDWDQVFNDVTNGTSTSGALAASFVTDAVNTTGDNIFTGGGSKDTQGIQQGQWLFTDSKPQAKNDIEHAYAATYTDPSNGHVLLFTGLDRFDNSGDATAGFWFFQNPIGQSTSNPTSSGSPFTGTHKDGDILLVSDFTIGGSTSTIKVFRWTGDDATGSLVQVAAPGTTTFAIVNSGSIAVPWTFTDKSHNTSPAAGEFLEEGVDLTALGLGGCFSNFLAETRSSQSPTATLSDFVIGSFNTCQLLLPNTATVQADGIAPMTSNEVVITVNDGHAMEAASVGGGAATDGLTMQQLQAAVAQGVAAWRAAGVDASTLSNLAQVRVHIGDLPGAELGYTAGGDVWIDPTAAGWGWSIAGTPTAGRMDLVTVVTHELGHVLGFEHDGAGVMETALTPGVRLLPEAIPAAGAAAGSPGLPAGATATVTLSVSLAADLAVAPSAAPLTSSPRTEAPDAALAAGVRDPAAPAAAAAAFSDGASNQRGLAGILLNPGPQAAAVPPAASAASAVGSAGSDQGVPAVPAPVLRPPGGVEGGGGAAVAADEAPDAVPAVGPASTANPAGAALDPQGQGRVEAAVESAAEPAEARSQRRASDACFADGTWTDEPVGSSGPAVAPATALALGVLGGLWGAEQAGAAPRTRRRLPI